MKPAVILCLIGLGIGAAAAQAQQPFEIRPKRLTQTDFAFALLHGSPVRLAGPGTASSQPFDIRLWRADVERSCGPAGHLICAYRYFLAVGERGEGGDEVVYDLGEFGGIQGFAWRSKESDDRAILEITALNYPTHVFKYWPGLQRVSRTFVLSISIDSLSVRVKR